MRSGAGLLAILAEAGLWARLSYHALHLLAVYFHPLLKNVHSVFIDDLLFAAWPIARVQLVALYTRVINDR